LEEKTKKSDSSHNFFKICSGRRAFYISIVAIPVTVLLFYGIEDKNAWFFGHDYINDYRYRIENNVVYHIGIMVSHYALIVTLSILGILIGWIIYEVLKLSNVKINNSALKTIILLLMGKNFAFWNKNIQNRLMKIKSSTIVSIE
jgi:hypothetical protein